MPKKIPAAMRERGVRMVLEHLEEYPNLTAACESVSNKRLKRENHELREANAILRDAAVFFAGELDPRRR